MRIQSSLLFLKLPVFLLMNASLLLNCTKRTGDVLPVVPVLQDTAYVNASKKTYLALGDSYTIGQSVPAIECYPVQTVGILRVLGYNVADPEIIATTGWTTADLLNALQNKAATPSYNVVTLLIGVNNQYQGGSIDDYRKEFSDLLSRSIQLAGNKPGNVIVLSVPDYSVTPYAMNADKAKIANEIDMFNAVNKELSTRYNVNYINVTGESRKAAADADLIASDGLHFSRSEYKIWAQLLVPVMENCLK